MRPARDLSHLEQEPPRATPRARSARDAALFIFFNRRRTALKALFADGTGLCIFYKRLDRGCFRLPEAIDGGRVVELNERELDDLLDGIEIEHRAAAKPAKRSVH